MLNYNQTNVQGDIPMTKTEMINLILTLDDDKISQILNLLTQEQLSVQASEAHPPS